MSHTWVMKGKWENQNWNYHKNGEVYVTITEKCQSCKETRKIRFKRIFKRGEII